MKCIGILFSVLLAFAVTAAQAQEFTPVPPLQARVTDTINMLDPQQRASLENVLTEYEAQTGSQIAVLLISSTAPETIEQYSIRVTDEWKLGREGVDDGVLLLVAKDNSSGLGRLRIEAGRGVQGSLTDAQSKRVLQDVIAPYFRQNDFYGGLAAGVSTIAALLNKESFPEPQQQNSAGAAGQQEASGFSVGIFFFAMLAFMMLSHKRAKRRRALRRQGWGRSAPGIILGAALGGALGGYGRGYGGGGGFGGGGFGGGGFSGGGGGFDGGGASGDW